MENKFVITIGRQVGAGGYDTARALSKEFGIKVYDSELLDEVAKHSGLSPEIFAKSDEKASSRGLKGFFGFRALSHVNESMTSSNMLSDDALFRIQSEVIQKLASEESCIIIGRCSDYVLRDYPNVVNVFISACFESRVKRIMNGRGLTESEARRFIEQGERKRSDYYNYFTFKKWGDSSSYDLCIDSSKLGDDEMKVVEIIKNYMKTRGIL